MERVITLQRLKYFELELLRMPCMPYKFSHFLKNYIAKLVLCLFRTGSQHSGEETCTSCHTRSNGGEQLTEQHWACTAPPGASKSFEWEELLHSSFLLFWLIWLVGCFWKFRSSMLVSNHASILNPSFSLALNLPFSLKQSWHVNLTFKQAIYLRNIRTRRRK